MSPSMDPATSLTTAEQALRDAITAILHKEHGPSWMDVTVASDVRQRWRDIRDQEARQRVGHVLSAVTELDYAYLGDLVQLIKKKGHWARLFEPVLGPKDEVFALLDLLQRVRRPVDHSRPLLPFEDDLASGIAGYIRNRVTIYLSSQDLDGDYYPRIERIEDNFGNAFTYTPALDLGQPQGVSTSTVLRVGDVVTYRCQGTDPQGRPLRWTLLQTPPGDTIEDEGESADLSWTVRPIDTGPQRWTLISLTHGGVYHRNIQGIDGADAIVIFNYRVVPPS